MARIELTSASCIDSLEQTVKAKGFKHSDFWDCKSCIDPGGADVVVDFKSAGKSVSKISEEEAEAAMEGFE